MGTVERDIEDLLAKADRLDSAGLLLLAARPTGGELDAARRRARQLVHRRGLDEELERIEGRIAVWSFVDGARDTGMMTWVAPGQDVVADLRRQASPALLDAVLVAMLGTALDEMDRDLLLDRWRQATDAI